jgi:hypothetical protein
MKLLRLFSLAAALAVLTAARAAAGTAENTLCGTDESVVFSCHVGKKIVSLCRPAAGEKALVYRFGAPGLPELVFPESGHAGGPDFMRADAVRFGGGLTSVSFQRGEYRYSVYSHVGRSEGPERTPEIEDGVLVLRNGRPLRRLVCDDGGEGFREDISWLPAAAK